MSPCENPDVSGVPVGFPFKLDDEDLDKTIADMLEPTNWPGFHDFAGLQTELKFGLVAAGLQERQRREEATAASRALRVAYAILATSIVALLVAVIAALVTAFKA